MSRRIDIELTSAREDGSWTWRAAGAKQPKGALDGALLPQGAAVGDEMRADVETTLDGTDVLSVSPPKVKNRSAGESIEIIPKGLKDEDLVITTLAKRGKGDRGGRGDRGDRGDRGPRRDGRDGDRRPRGDGAKPGGPRGERGERRDRPEGGDRPDRPRRDRPAPPAKPKAKRLRPGRTHRKAALDALAPEEQVIAEQVLKGGVPAVRQAVERMNEEAKAEGRPEVKPDALVAVAERLLPALRAAEWRDRAEAAVTDLAELDLRDLRSVVVAAEGGTTKDDESRALAATLRDGLSQRVDQEQAAWLAELSETLTEGRVVRALRLSSRPPKAGAPLPAELATRLAEAASGALTADTVADRWATVLDALSFSPVRLTVSPASKPETPNEELVAVVTRIAGRVPKVAEAFGIEAPADAPRKRGRAGGRGPKPGGNKPGGPKGAGPKPGGGRPPRPPKPPTGDGTATGAEAASTPEAPAPSSDAGTPADAGETAVVAEQAASNPEPTGTPDAPAAAEPAAEAVAAAPSTEDAATPPVAEASETAAPSASAVETPAEPAETSEAPAATEAPAAPEAPATEG